MKNEKKWPDTSVKEIREILSRFSPKKILVNTIEQEDGSLAPSEVCEMHVADVDGEMCLLITPKIIAMDYYNAEDHIPEEAQL